MKTKVNIKALIEKKSLKVNARKVESHKCMWSLIFTNRLVIITI